MLVPEAAESAKGGDAAFGEMPAPVSAAMTAPHPDTSEFHPFPYYKEGLAEFRLRSVFRSTDH